MLLSSRRGVRMMPVHTRGFTFKRWGQASVISCPFIHSMQLWHYSSVERRQQPLHKCTRRLVPSQDKTNVAETGPVYISGNFIKNNPVDIQKVTATRDLDWYQPVVPWSNSGTWWWEQVSWTPNVSCFNDKSTWSCHIWHANWRV